MTTIWTYPWDMVDEGPGAVADEIAAAGLDGISLAATYHSFDALRPRRPAGGRLLTVSASAGYYPFDPASFSGTPLLPDRASLVSGEAWTKCTSAAQASNLKVVAWTIFLHNSFLAARHPEAAQMTCFGEPLSHQLCPAQPSVRAYAKALASDICRLPDVDILECEGLSFSGYGHAHFHPKVGIDLGNGGRFLMSLCFCEACTKQAESKGIDVNRVRVRANEKVDAIFSTGRPLDADPKDLIAGDSDFQAFTSFREDRVTDLVASVASAAGKPIRVLAMGDRNTTALNVRAVAPLVDAVEYLCYTPDPNRLRQTIQQAVSDTGSVDKVGAGIQAYPPASPDAETLTETVAAARGCGIRLLSFYNFGLMPRLNMTWIKQALESTR